MRFPVLFVLLGLLVGTCGTLHAQFQTPSIDGNVAGGEYGSHVDGANQQANGGTTWFMTWDDNSLYIAYTGSNITEGAALYIDTNPIVPVNGGTDADGSNQGFFTYDRNHMMPPFRADFVVYFKSTYNEYRYADGAGYWGGQTSFALPIASNGGSNTIELAIPWSVVTNGGTRPDQFNWFGYKMYDYGAGTNGVYQPVPTANPGCTCNTDPSQLYATHYYNVLATADGSSTLPFSTQSLTYHEDNSGPGGGLYLNTASLYDLTINNNSPDNTDNDPGNHVYDNNGPANRVLVEGTIDIAHNLYVGAGSALLPANNAPSDVLATVTFTGRPGSLYNFGRIDPNPEAAGANDWDRRRINFVFDGVTTIEATDLFKDRFRLGNVTVNAGDSLLGPAADSASIELQWGVFENNGVVEFGGAGNGFVDLGTRGDWGQQNDYFLNGSGGAWHLHDILVGRNSSHLQPVNGGGALQLELTGDFENYDEFTAKAGTGEINVLMNGTERQYIRGNVTETDGATTTFHDLEIANDNGSGGNNDQADVWFESFGGGTIDYFLTGTLTLTTGDLVTRHRSSGTAHRLTLRDSAQVDATNASSNTSARFSSMVDGPLSVEVENSSAVTKGFPLGKTGTISSTSIGDFRPVGLLVDLDAVTRTTFTAEMFLDNRSTFYTWPAPVPEVIAWISPDRYWNVTLESGGANLQTATIALSYDSLALDDGVTAPSTLRIVKDNGAGNWVNITPLGPVGTAVGTGTITSQPFASFSDFTLARVTTGSLPVILGDFTARRRDTYTALRWTTLEEVNVDYFEVEKSADQLSWTPVGRVDAAGNSSSNLAYQLDDPDWAAGVTTYYYRLRTVDIDGSTDFSQVRTVTLDGHATEWAVYPNPATDGFWLDAPMEGRFTIYALTGQEMYASPVEAGLHHVRPPLSAGVYMVEFVGANGQRRVEKLWWK